jgi:hypothetical protein
MKPLFFLIFVLLGDFAAGSGDTTPAVSCTSEVLKYGQSLTLELGFQGNRTGRKDKAWNRVSGASVRFFLAATRSESTISLERILSFSLSEFATAKQQYLDALAILEKALATTGAKKLSDFQLELAPNRFHSVVIDHLIAGRLTLVQEARTYFAQEDCPVGALPEAALAEISTALNQAFKNRPKAQEGFALEDQDIEVLKLGTLLTRGLRAVGKDTVGKLARWITPQNIITVSGSNPGSYQNVFEKLQDLEVPTAWISPFGALSEGDLRTTSIRDLGFSQEQVHLMNRIGIFQLADILEMDREKAFWLLAIKRGLVQQIEQRIEALGLEGKPSWANPQISAAKWRNQSIFWLRLPIHRETPLVTAGFSTLKDLEQTTVEELRKLTPFSDSEIAQLNDWLTKRGLKPISP